MAARLLLAALSLVCVRCQLEQMPKKPRASPLNGDIKYITCQVCELMVANAFAHVTSAKAEQKPNTQQKRRFEARENLGGLEAAVEDIVTSICDAESKGEPVAGRAPCCVIAEVLGLSCSEGKWISEYDVVKRGTALKLEHQACALPSRRPTADGVLDAQKYAI